MKQPPNFNPWVSIAVGLGLAVTWLILGMALDASPTYIVGGVIGALTAPAIFLARTRGKWKP